MSRLPPSCSVAPAGPGGGAKDFETASLSFKLNISKYDPSWTRGVGEPAETDGAGDGFLKLLRDNLLRGRAARSKVSGRGEAVGAGDDGRLAGRKNKGVLSAFIIAGGI